MKKCLLSGTSGLIGSHLIPHLENWEIYGISRHLPHASQGSIVNPVRLDLASPWSEDTLPDKVDAVVHLAQSENFRNFPDAAESVFHVNTVSTLKLLDYARQAGAETFILASSGGVYGFGDKPFAEDADISYGGELGFYMKTKLCSEILAETYSPYMNIIILRFFFVYGPGQRENMLVPRLVNSVLDGKPIMLQGDDGIRINPTHVNDAARAISRALTLEKSDTINIGGPEVLSLRQIGNTIGTVLRRKPAFQMEPIAESRDLVADIQKMIELLGMPETSFDKGVHDYIQHTFQTLPA